LYLLAVDPTLQKLAPDLSAREIERLRTEHADDVSPQRLAILFGTPKPTLTHSYNATFLHLRTFPTLMGYSSRILAETWESNNLYYAALADELGIPANQLDRYVPDWTRSTVENIFATHLEDWPALVRSLQVVGDHARGRGVQNAALLATQN
jgi:hypothetical protein